MGDGGNDVEYLSVEDVLTIHDVIVESDAETEPGISSRGDVEYTVDHIQSEFVDGGTDQIHVKAFQLLRLPVATSLRRRKQADCTRLRRHFLRAERLRLGVRSGDP